MDHSSNGPSRQPHATAATRIGHPPTDPDAETILTPQELRAGTYIEGGVPDQQTALCTNLMAQWARAGYGFCYVHPDAFSTLDVLYALPDERLDDIIWINLRPARLADHLDVPADQRIAIDPIDVTLDRMAPEACETYPTSACVGDYLDVLAHDGPADDWNIGSLLATVLDQATIDDECSYTDLLDTLHSAHYSARYTDEAGVTALRDWIDDAATAWYDGLHRAEQLDTNAFDSARQLLSDSTLRGECLVPLRGTTSCVLQDAVRDDAIILVTGDLPDPAATGTVPCMRRLATRLLATVVVRRVWEGLQSEAPSARDPRHGDKPPCYPVVLDGITRLFAHEPQLLTELLETGTTDETALALVCTGHTPTQFGDTVQAAISQSISTRIVFEDQSSDDALRTLYTDMTILEQRLEATQGAVGPPAACWVKRDAGGMVTSTDDLGGFKEFVPCGPPDYVQSSDTVAEVIQESQRRPGTAHPMAN